MFALILCGVDALQSMLHTAEKGSCRCASPLMQVVIQEGPGWIIDQWAYKEHLKKFGMTEDVHSE